MSRAAQSRDACAAVGRVGDEFRGHDGCAAAASSAGKADQGENVVDRADTVSAGFANARTVEVYHVEGYGGKW